MEGSDLSDTARYTVFAALKGAAAEIPSGGSGRAASAPRARFNAITVLTPGERLLVCELLA